jgi:serine/threonine-protein kinase
MAPEQAKGARDLDHRVDLYAAGVILYEAITGEVPFNADTFNELLFKIVLEAARPVEQVVPGIDPSFAGIVNKSMAREPAARFQTAREFQQALEQWAAGAGPQFAAPAGAPAHAPAPHAPMGTGAYAAAGTPPQAVLGTGQYPAANPAAPAHTLGTGTPGNWANTGAYPPAEAAPKKSNTGLFVGLAAVGVLLLGGGAFVAMSLGHSKDEAAAAAGKAEAEKDAEKAKAEAAEKAAQDVASKAAAEAEKAKAQAAAAMSEAEKAKAAAEAEKAKLAAAATAPAPRGAAPRPAAPTKTTEPKPAAAAVPAPAPAAPAPASTGRRIRTSL